MFTIQQLRFLVAVVDYGGVVRAAERLHISQPSISTGLKVLEQELGQTMFDRNSAGSRQMVLTSAGRRFYRDAVDILRQCEAAQGSLRNDAEVAYRLRGGILDTLPQVATMALLRAFEAHGGAVQLDVWEGTVERVAGWLTQGRVDVIWSNVHDLSLNTQVLWREPLMAVVSKKHPFATSGGRISVRDLASQPFVHRTHCEFDSGGRAQLRAAGVKLDVRARAGREELAFQLVRSGKYITLAPQSLVPHDLLKLEVTGLNLERSIGLQWRENLDPALLSLVKDAVQEASQMVIQPAKNRAKSK